MPDETESAVAAWLDSPSTVREVKIAMGRLGCDQYQATLFALCIEILAAVDLYGPPTDDDPDDPDEPWKPRLLA